jgi:hypothetical protein
MPPFSKMPLKRFGSLKLQCDITSRKHLANINGKTLNKKKLAKYRYATTEYKKCLGLIKYFCAKLILFLFTKKINVFLFMLTLYVKLPQISQL